jgi:thiol-disulfide isomerase/thioredoxin
MKTLKILAAITVVSFCLPGYAQNNALTVKPSNPKRGDSVVLTYSPEKSPSGLKGVKTVTAHILYADQIRGDILDKEMVGKKDSWKATFQVPDEAYMMAVRFTSDEKADDNNGDCWYIPVYGKDKKPLKNAFLVLESLHEMGEFQGFRFEKSKEAAKKYLEMELGFYPDNVTVHIREWAKTMNKFKYNDSIKNQIRKEVLTLYHSNSSDEKDISNLLYWFNRTGMQKEGQAIKDSIINANPYGFVALENKLKDVLYKPDPPADEIEKIVRDFPDMESSTKNLLGTILVKSYIKTQDFQKAEEVISKTDIKDGMLFNNLAWPLIEKGENLEKATAWAAKGVELISKQKAGSKSAPPNQIKNLNNSLGTVLDTYGYGLEKLGKTGEALKAYAEAFELMEGMDEEVNSRYAHLLAGNGEYNKAIEVAETCILKGKANDKLKEAFKEAFKQLNGSSDEAENKLNQLVAEAKTRLMENLKKEMLNKPAPDFSLRDFDGNVVKLSDLKGKVVVVDFWATWCGPCKMSFPGLQKVYEKYKDNPEIQILALDTWEREKTVAEKEQKARDFITENKYTFRVLFDDANIVRNYGVTGIPTKFVIDKNGMIQFKTIGFTGEKEMISEMEAQFELLLNDNK